ncbi:gamma subclass chorismate mutase AroQ [Nocardia sp. NPDC004722]
MMAANTVIHSAKNLAMAAVSSIAVLGGQTATASTAQADPPAPLDHLVALVAERLDTADTVAAVKWSAALADGSQPTIDDPVREAQVYDAMAQLGADKGLPAARVREIFTAQIDANKIVQRGLVTQWQYGLTAPGSPAGGLGPVRAVIDRVNTEIIDELAADRTELARPGCPARLADSVLATVRATGSDPLHQAALVRAVLPLCES